MAEQRDRLTGRRTTRLPKGKGEPGETLEQTALREVREEVGLRGRVVGPLESVRYGYREGAVPVAKEVHYFLMECLPGEPLPLDGEMDRVHWLALDEAAASLSFETERRVLDVARRRLEGGAEGAP